MASPVKWTRDKNGSYRGRVGCISVRVAKLGGCWVFGYGDVAVVYPARTRRDAMREAITYATPLNTKISH